MYLTPKFIFRIKKYITHIWPINNGPHYKDNMGPLERADRKNQEIILFSPYDKVEIWLPVTQNIHNYFLIFYYKIRFFILHISIKPKFNI